MAQVRLRVERRDVRHHVASLTSSTFALRAWSPHNVRAWLLGVQDTTESDLKQRREIGRGGTMLFIDQAAVQAALSGRVLIIEGLEKAPGSERPPPSMFGSSASVDRVAALLLPIRLQSAAMVIESRKKDACGGRHSGRAHRLEARPRRVAVFCGRRLVRVDRSSVC